MINESYHFYAYQKFANVLINTIGLDENNVKEIYENSYYKSILNDYRRYNKSKYLKCYYDFKNFRDNILTQFDKYEVFSVDGVDIKWDLWNDHFIEYYCEVILYIDNR